MASNLAHVEVHFEAIGPDARIHEIAHGIEASMEARAAMYGENYRINICLGDTRDEGEAVDLDCALGGVGPNLRNTCQGHCS